MMVTRGLLVKMEAKPDKKAEVEAFLLSATPLVQQESATTAWFAIRFGPSKFGIFDAFPDDVGRDAHLSGPVAKALLEQAELLLIEPPKIQKVTILADKLPVRPLIKPNTKALLLTFKPKAGNQQGVEQFLQDAKPLVEAEPDTTAWFALHLDDGSYGIFDVFPSHLGRLKHLTGRVPQALAKHALSLLGSIPVIHLPNVLAEKLGRSSAI